MEFLGADLKIESKLVDKDVEITIYLPRIANYKTRRCFMNIELSEVRLHSEEINSYNNVKTTNLVPNLEVSENGRRYTMKISNFEENFQDRRYPKNTFFELRFAAALQIKGFVIKPKTQIGWMLNKNINNKYTQVNIQYSILCNENFFLFFFSSKYLTITILKLHHLQCNNVS